VNKLYENMNSYFHTKYLAQNILALPMNKLSGQKSTLSQDSHSWALGAVDSFHNRPSREGVNDPLAYASGRVEGEAWRLLNLDLGEQLKKNKLLYPV
jgi:hypothetical protein